MSEAELDRADALRARARVYGLLAHLVLRGLDAERLATHRALGWLVPEHDELELGAALDLDLDAVAADHHRWFQLELFPYAGVYLDPSARAGAWAERVRHHYARAGFRPRLDELAADHLGIELAFASFVSAAASEALDDGHVELADQLLDGLLAFFDEALLSWLPALVAAAESLGPETYWTQVIHAILELVAEHRQALVRRPDQHQRSAPGLAPSEDILADHRTGLRRVAEHLLVPAASGLGLTRADLARLGRNRALPRGFGSRLIMLDNLLRSAVDYGQLDALLADLRALVGERDTRYAELTSSLGLGPALDPWRAALTATQALLDTIAAAAPHTLADPQPPHEAQPWTSKPSTTTPPAP